jgi:hypothetical protein
MAEPAKLLPDLQAALDRVPHWMVAIRPVKMP